MRKIMIIVSAFLFMSTHTVSAEEAAPAAATPAPSASYPTQPAANVTAVSGDYVIGAGDVLDISVWKDEALTKTVVVLPDGKISFPLIGQINAAGKTLLQLRQEVEQKLVRFVPDMVLSLEVKQCNSMLIYVIGRVNNPGRFVLNTNVNVLQALSMAGGLNPFAKKDDIKIFRKDGNDTRILPFRYDKVADGKLLDDNILLKQGDLILVP